jgi:hypothetical protein
VFKIDGESHPYIVRDIGNLIRLNVYSDPQGDDGLEEYLSAEPPKGTTCRIIYFTFLPRLSGSHTDIVIFKVYRKCVDKAAQ